MLNWNKNMKGQLSFVNLVGSLVILILFFTMFLPIYQPIANTAVAGLDVTWQFYSMTVTIIQIIPFFMLVLILLGFMAWAQPRYG